MLSLGKENLIQTTNSTVLDKIAIGLSEFFGTAILVFIACMGCVPGVRSNEIVLHQSALISGLAVMITIFVSIFQNYKTILNNVEIRSRT